MNDVKDSAAKVLDFGRSKKRKQRKSDINRNRFGSVRNVNGQVYVDFMYLGERVREPSGLACNDVNKREIRERLDRIGMQIKAGTFRYADVFPTGKKRDLFTAKERTAFGYKESPNDVLFGNHAKEWFDLKSQNGTVTGRTLRDYKSYNKNYLTPFFGKKSFAELSAHELEQFIIWARDQKLKGERIRYESIKKYFVVLRMICNHAAVKFKWTDFNPFFGFEGFRNRKDEDVFRKNVADLEHEDDMAEEDEENEKIAPFSIDEVRRIRRELPDHWKPYLDFAVSAGLRPGEQIALKPHNVNWEEGTVTIRKAMTLDIEGKPVEGRTKNEYSRRTIRLTRAMLSALIAQKEIHDRFGCKYFFCSPTGCQVDLSNFRNQVWIGALERAGINPYRSIRQARHTFATLAISRGEDLSWIAKVMGHANTLMIHTHYARFIEDANGTVNGSKLDDLFETQGKDE